MAQAVGASSHTLKGRGFDSQSGHISSLQVSPQDETRLAKRLMFLSHINASLSLSKINIFSIVFFKKTNSAGFLSFTAKFLISVHLRIYY